MNKLPITMATAAVAVLAGCTSVPAQPATNVPSGSNQPPAAATSAPAATTAAPEPSQTPTPTTASQQEGVAAFGTAYAWEDGLSLTVGTPSEYKPSKWAAKGETFKDFVVFDVRVVNDTGQPWDPAMIYGTLQSANQEGERVFDSGQLPPEPSTKLLDGREVTFKMAFGVADPADLVLEIAPDWDHESVLFHADAARP